MSVDRSLSPERIWELTKSKPSCLKEGHKIAWFKCLQSKTNLSFPPFLETTVNGRMQWACSAEKGWIRSCSNKFVTSWSTKLSARKPVTRFGRLHLCGGSTTCKGTPSRIQFRTVSDVPMFCQARGWSVPINWLAHLEENWMAGRIGCQLLFPWILLGMRRDHATDLCPIWRTVCHWNPFLLEVDKMLIWPQFPPSVRFAGVQRMKWLCP